MYYITDWMMALLTQKVADYLLAESSLALLVAHDMNWAKREELLGY